MSRGQIQHLQRHAISQLCQGFPALSRDVAGKDQSSGGVVPQVSLFFRLLAAIAWYQSKLIAFWRARLPKDISLDLGAILEPLGVAIHAARRAQVAPNSTTLVFGAGAVGLLCAAMAKASGSTKVIIADIDKGRVEFATQNKFAHAGFVVPMKRAQTIEEKLQIAKDTAALAAQLEGAQGEPVGEVDLVFECTGVESCLQAAIYVSSSIPHCPCYKQVAEYRRLLDQAVE